MLLAESGSYWWRMAGVKTSSKVKCFDMAFERAD